MANNFFMYKDYPLVRCGKQIYYGYMSEPYVVMMEVTHESQVDSMSVADEIKVYMMSTKEANPMKAIVNNAKRGTLLEAVELGNAWLKRSEKEAAAQA